MVLSLSEAVTNVSAAEVKSPMSGRIAGSLTSILPLLLSWSHGYYDIALTHLISTVQPFKLVCARIMPVKLKAHWQITEAHFFWANKKGLQVNEPGSVSTAMASYNNGGARFSSVDYSCFILPRKKPTRAALIDLCLPAPPSDQRQFYVVPAKKASCVGLIPCSVFQLGKVKLVD